jgi:hypothetical protein
MALGHQLPPNLDGTLVVSRLDQHQGLVVARRVGVLAALAGGAEERGGLAVGAGLAERHPASKSPAPALGGIRSSAETAAFVRPASRRQRP